MAKCEAKLSSAHFYMTQLESQQAAATASEREGRRKNIKIMKRIFSFSTFHASERAREFFLQHERECVME
jgi:hypothetical protein